MLRKFVDFSRFFFVLKNLGSRPYFTALVLTALLGLAGARPARAQLDNRAFTQAQPGLLPQDSMGLPFFPRYPPARPRASCRRPAPGGAGLYLLQR